MLDFLRHAMSSTSRSILPRSKPSRRQKSLQSALHINGQAKDLSPLNHAHDGYLLSSVLADGLCLAILARKGQHRRNIPVLGGVVAQ